MKESYGEGVATHPGPESCGHDRKVRHEALTGGTVGQGELNREIPKLQDADALTRCGRPHLRQRSCELPQSPARSKTLARRDTSCTEVGRSRVLPEAAAQPGRIGKSTDWSR
jgi:hypothetical protein